MARGGIRDNWLYTRSMVRSSSPRLLRFACPGTPKSTPGKGGTLEGLEQAKSLGIDAMEIEWVQSVPKNVAHVREVGLLAERLDVTLTVHAPYFINLNSDDPEKIIASERRILDALSMAQECGALSVCVHAAFNGKADSETVTESVRRATERLMKQKPARFPDVNLAYETMGKHSQWGTLEETLLIAKEFEIYPCVDTAHMHARANGGVNTEQEWDELFDRYAHALGDDALGHMHLHYSGIAYSDKGEKHHLPFEESDANWKGFLRVVKRRGIGGVLVCESPAMENDTLLLQRTYAKL